MGGISIWQLLIILAIVALLFGTRKLRNIGSDLGGAVKGFKQAMSDEEKQSAEKAERIESEKSDEVIDAKAEKVEESEPAQAKEKQH